MDIKYTAHRRIAGRAGGLSVLTLMAFLMAVFCMGTPVALAQGEGDRTVVGSDLHVGQGEVVKGNATVTNGDIDVEGQVQGNVVVVNGDASINGEVDGDVSVAGGDAQLGPNSHVTGNILMAGGSLERAPGAFVGGHVSDLDLSSLPGLNSLPAVSETPQPLSSTSSVGGSGFSEARNFARGFNGPFGRSASLIIWLGVSLVLALFILAFALIVPTRLIVARDTVDAAPGPVLVVGLVTAFLLSPAMGIVSVVLAITVVGIALIPVLGIIVGLALLFGLGTVSLWLGRRVSESVRHPQHEAIHGPQRVMLETALGLAVILAATLLPSLLLPGWIGLLMWGVVYFAACIGLGAGLMSRLGTLAPPVRRTPVVS